MRSIKPSIFNDKRRKSKPWRVRFQQAGKSQSKFFRTKKEAIVHQQMVMDSLNKEIIDQHDIGGVYRAIQILRASGNPDVESKDLEFAVTWFVENFKDTEGVKTFAKYFSEFMAEKKRVGIGKDQIASDQQQIGTKGKDSFVNKFGERKASDITSAEIEKFIESRSQGSQWHMAKAVTAFFNFMSGNNRKLHCENPPFAKLRNPMKGVKIFSKKTRYERETATNKEVAEILKIANQDERASRRCGARFLFMFMTGTRPSECARFWDPKNKCGWRYIDFDRKEIIIPDEIIGKASSLGSDKTRTVNIRSGFLTLLKEFKRGGEAEWPLASVTGWKKKYGRIKKEVLGKRLPDPNSTKSITRHTFASNLFKYDGNIAQVSSETGDDEKTLKRHYIKASVTPAEAKEFFEEITLEAFKVGKNFKTAREERKERDMKEREARARRTEKSMKRIKGYIASNEP